MKKRENTFRFVAFGAKNKNKTHKEFKHTTEKWESMQKKMRDQTDVDEL